MPRTEIGAIVLAGGKSARFGRDKASVMLNGAPMLQHVVSRVAQVASEVVVVKAKGQTLPQVWPGVPLSVVEDMYLEAGPLGGLYTGFVALDQDVALAVACDMPLLQPALLGELVSLIEGHQAVVPMSDDGQPQPLCAVYSRETLKPILRRLRRKQLQLTGLLEDIDVLLVQPDHWRRFDPGGLSFMNANTEEAFAAVQALASAGAPPEARRARCEVWYGSRRCREAATHRTEHSGVRVCGMHASIWGAVFEEVEE